jgi:hypothetical protein
VFQLVGVAVIVSFNCGCLAGFFKFVFNFGAKSTQLCCFFQDTRSSAAFLVVIRSSRRKHKPHRSSVSGSWPACAREPFALWRTWQPRSAYSGRAQCWMESTVVDLRLGGTGEDTHHCLRRNPLLSLLPVACFLGFFCFMLCIPIVSPVQSACVLLNFYWNFCWLDARSALFYLRVSVNVRNAQM